MKGTETFSTTLGVIFERADKTFAVTLEKRGCGAVVSALHHVAVLRPASWVVG
jgi:hypothetical protein